MLSRYSLQSAIGVLVLLPFGCIHAFGGMRVTTSTRSISRHAQLLHHHQHDDDFRWTAPHSWLGSCRHRHHNEEQQQRHVLSPTSTTTIRRQRHLLSLAAKRSNVEDFEEEDNVEEFEENDDEETEEDDEVDVGKFGKGFEVEDEEDDEVFYGKFQQTLDDDDDDDDQGDDDEDDEDDETNGGNWKSTNNPSNFVLETFQDSQSTTTTTSTTTPDLGLIQKRMDAMQQQLDFLTSRLVVSNGLEPPSLLSAEQSDFLSSPPSKFLQPQHSTTASEPGSGNYIPSPQSKFMQQHQPLIVPPVKAMLFIDGTWLYYSIHERQGCAIQQKYGRGWQSQYQVDWAALPRLICQQLQLRRLRPVDMVRVLVFTSFKATTPKDSYRYQMYQDMQRQANYDVHMLETVGKSEKCVDISLAVEMLHYATVANAFDVAILVSGDKDFMPAMIRTRQKGRQVALASMRRACNREFTSNPHVKDFPTVWLEDYLDEWIVPKHGASSSGRLPQAQQQPSHIRSPGGGGGGGSASIRIPAFMAIPELQTVVMKRVILDFIIASGRSRVASRDIGRYLKMLILPSTPQTPPPADQRRFTMLDSVKLHSGSLFQFFNQMSYDNGDDDDDDGDNVFVLEDRSEDASNLNFWVGLNMEPEAAQEVVMKEFEERAPSFTAVERAIFETYSLDMLEDNMAAVYFHTYQADPVDRKSRATPGGDAVNGDSTPPPPIQLPEEFTRDYTLCTLVELKERCRERELPVSGTKAVLLERIRQDIEKGIARMEEKYASTANTVATNRRPSVATTLPTARNGREPPKPPTSLKPAPPSPSLQYLVGLVEEYLQARGGAASSRNVGRYLAANKASPAWLNLRGRESSALQELKVEFGTLRNFINYQSHLFVKGEEITSSSSPQTDDFGFLISLREKEAQEAQLP